LALLGAAPAPPVIDIALTGQALLRSDIRATAPGSVEAIRPMLHGDVIFTNFETTVAYPGQEVANRAMVFGPPETLDVVKELGVNLLAMSNNHNYDIGPRGILNSIAEADKRGIVHAGIGMNIAEAAAPAYLRTPKGVIALVSMASGMIEPGAMAGKASPGINEIRLVGATPGIDAGQPHPEDAKRTLASISEAARRADLVIAYQHNHAFDEDMILLMREEQPARLVPPRWIKAWAHREVDAGADIVVLHGAPLVHGVEIYRGKPIFYDLGNFIFQLPMFVDFFEPITFTSVIANVEFEGKRLKAISFQPIILNSEPRGEGPAAQFTRGIPAPATGKRAKYILQRLVDASAPFGTKIVVTGETARIELGAKR
jgi:poly-gamma-glutamate capsule biosynthesis protein CapA/YwtB (metallophosphatase superfamily)